MPKIKKLNVTILYANSSGVKKILKTSRNNAELGWIYLGKDVPFSLSLNKLFGEQNKRLKIADLLQDTAQETRQEYIDYIGTLSLINKTKYWWLTSISEKNPFISNIFLYFCYIRVILKIIGELDKDLVIICDSTALMEAIAQNLQGHENVSVHLDKPMSTQVLLSIKNHITGYIKTIHFLVRWTIRWLFAKIFGLIREKYRHEHQQQGEKIIIHSWADYRSFRVPGKYEDVFLGCLGSDLEKIHPGVCYLIDILPTCFFPMAFFKLIGLKKQILLMEEVINPRDIILSVYSVSTHFPDLQEIPRFMNLDVTPIVLEELEKDLWNPRTFQTYLFYIVGRNIARKSNVQSFIYSFENLMWEKMFCLAFREFSQKTAIIGYAHSTIGKMETFYSISANERNFMPLPDTIVVNGLRAHEALINSGFDSKHIVIGGAYRYHSLELSQPPKRKTTIKTILVVSPDDFNASLELVIKAIRAFGNRNEITCIIKFHPTLPRRKITSYLWNIPDNFAISEKSIDQLLPCADLVIYTGSTVAVEAVARGIPVLHVGLDLIIDRDIFNDRDQIISASQPEEIYQAFLMLSMKGNNPKIMGEQFVREFFAPIKDSDLNVFLGKRIE
jgi:hypothetical protein